MSDDRKRYIARYYAQMLNTEIAHMLGCSPSNVSRYLAAMGLTRSAEDIAKLRERAVARWRETCIANNSHLQRSRKLKQLYKYERMCKLMGQPQRTNMRVNIETSQQTRERYNLNRLKQR